MTPSSKPVPSPAGMAVTILCAVCLVAGAGAAQAGVNVWTTDGPDNGRVMALAIDPVRPSTLYAGTNGGSIFKSTDAGGTWTAVKTGSAVWALAIDPVTPSTLYAGMVTGGVFKSTDGGDTWRVVGDDVGGFPLAIDPAAPSTLYAGGNKSADGGRTWQSIEGGLNNPIWAIGIDPITPSTLYAGTIRNSPFNPAGGIFKSTDGGDHWTPLDTGVHDPLVAAFAIDPRTPGTLYVGIRPGGVFKSPDGGSTWGVGLSNPEVTALVLDPISPTTLYAGTTGGVLKSTDGGDTWNPLNTGLTNLDVTALAVDPIDPRRVYAGTGGTGSAVFAIDQLSACAGDCVVDGNVTVAEVITMVNIALGTGSMAECGSGDANHDNVITVDEILTAVDAALNGCPTPPLPTPRFLTEDATLYDYWPCFSPDGRSVLFSRTADGVHWELRLVPVAGGPSVSFATTPLPVSATRANWSPSGDRIAFTGTAANGTSTLWLISATGTDAHQVKVSGLSGLVFYPSFYPDGNRLAITDLGAGRLNGGVVRMVDLAQGTVTSLTDHSEFLAGMPAVSPDGQRVAFAGQRNVGQTYDETQNSIFILEPSGAVTQPDAGLGRTPAWFPDGEWIAFESDRASPEGRYAAFIMRPDGSGLRRLTDVSIDANHPVFSPDGKLLALSATRPGWPITARGIAMIELPDL